MTAYVLVLEEDRDADVAPAAGALLARHADAVTEAAMLVGYGSLDGFASMGAEDLMALGVDPGEAEGADGWHDAADGVGWFQSMRALLSREEDVEPDQAAVLVEVEVMLRALEEARRRGSRFRLEIDL